MSWGETFRTAIEALLGRRMRSMLTADRSDDVRSEGNVRYEMTVHDVDVDVVGARGVHSADFLAQPGKIGG